MHPKIFRIGQIYGWDSKWYSKRKNYPALLREDILIKGFLKKILKDAGIDSVIVERTQNSLTIVIAAAKPGFIIGRGGVGAEELKKKIIGKFFKGKKINLNLNIVEVAKPSLSSNVVLRDVVDELEKRTPFKRVMKRTIVRVSQGGARGVKVMISGRLDGNEIARSEARVWGEIPLQTLRADIDYSQGTAQTIYGVLGVKIWIYKGEVFEK